MQMQRSLAAILQKQFYNRQMCSLKMCQIAMLEYVGRWVHLWFVSNFFTEIGTLKNAKNTQLDM